MKKFKINYLLKFWDTEITHSHNYLVKGYTTIEELRLQAMQFVVAEECNCENVKAIEIESIEEVTNES
ncbi:MAG: hypothetical protein ACEQSR_01510 [Candidatus Methylacidiphilales bacterium]